VIHHYGSRPEFVLIGGLVPDLLCAASPYTHAGTTDIDVQVDLEIHAGAVNAAKLERALTGAEFVPDGATGWRWISAGPAPRAVVKFELLADSPTAPAGATLTFDECAHLAAANLRGTGYAAQDVSVREIRSRVDGSDLTVEVNVTGLAGFLLAKIAAARSRRKPKDWYDIAFVLLHNDLGGTEAAAGAIRARFGRPTAELRAAADDLQANFATPSAQGSQAYAAQMLLDHPELDRVQLLADATIAVEVFRETLDRE
jgi:Nucleotidyl transferase AbiEii toxin, Type IV TA system